jgi:hypothetical protein
VTAEGELGRALIANLELDYVAQPNSIWLNGEGQLLMFVDNIRLVYVLRL